MGADTPNPLPNPMNTRLLLPAIALLAPVLGFAAPPLAVSGAWIRATPPGVSTAAAYLTITNDGASADRLLGATSPVARALELHANVEDHGVRQMRPLAEVTVPAHGSLELTPGGTHVMLIDISAPMKPGARVPLTLHFAIAGDIEVDVPVRDARTDPQHH
jgi:copper(I)-binding protein